MKKTRVSVTIPVTVRSLLRTIGHIADQDRLPAYAVGGCVRDWMLRHRATPDLDITVEGSGVELARHVAKALQGTLTVHEQFGTATVKTRHLRLDVATCRKERYTKPAAYPKVSAGRLRDDLFRRDFTVNAMAVAIVPKRFGELIDPFHGLQDLRRKQLRMLHERSFFDDPSRILRGVRFAQRFGLHWEPTTEEAARRAIVAGALGWLNTGRLRKELDRMLNEPNPRACLRGLAMLLDPLA